MNISTTKRTARAPYQIRKTSPSDAPGPQLSRIDRLEMGLLQRIGTDPVPQGSKLTVLLPAAGGVALGAAVGLIGEGLGAGAAIPGIAALGLAGAALGSRLDNVGSKTGKRWTTTLGIVGASLGAAGVVAGAVGGVPGAVAGGLSLGGAGFALGHLFGHLNR